MNFGQRKLFHELLASLRKAHMAMARLLPRSPQKLETLADEARNCLALLLESIESGPGRPASPGAQTAILLRQYRELLPQLCGGQGDSQKAQEAFAGLTQLLGQIITSAAGELPPETLEVLFLPYKASMWDALASVWRAAASDPHCSARIVPLPFRAKNPDGSLGPLHCEKDLFPQNLPLEDWRDCDLEARRPDIIFIHNPFDANNLVTSVPPAFYSERLKNCTDLLVYIPYFVTSEGHLTPGYIMAGIVHAHKVIVESEDIRQRYIFSYKLFEQDNNCQGCFGQAESKFVALGSPKFDAVDEAARQEKSPELLRLVERPDGLRRPVVLYNTTLTSLLDNTPLALRRILKVFACFKKRNDALLLWRPHPLSAETLRAMRPALAESYLGLVDIYRREAFGLYDDSPDLHRAIAVSDAYYGDWSSLVGLYRHTGKPALIRSLHGFAESRKKRLPEIMCMTETPDSFWLGVRGINALLDMDKKNWRITCAGHFSDEAADNPMLLYRAMAPCGDKLLLAPAAAENFAIFDPASGQTRTLPLKAPSKPLHYRHAKFWSACVYHDQAFFVGCYYPALVRYDGANCKLDYFDDWAQYLHKNLRDRIVPFFYDAVRVGGKLFAPAACANAVLEFDLESCLSRLHEVGAKNMSYSGICHDGVNLWLSPLDFGPVVQWRPGSSTWVEHGAYPENMRGARQLFAGISHACGQVWLLPRFANLAVKINTASGVMEEVEALRPKGGTNNVAYTFQRVVDNKLYCYAQDRSRFIEYDCAGGDLRGKALGVENQEELMRELRALRKRQRSLGKSFHLVHENSFMTLDDFLDDLVLEQNSVNSAGGGEKAGTRGDADIGGTGGTGEKTGERRGTIGEAIYAYCKAEAQQ
ncbi:hypothetical protein LJC15_02985 [Desulfovibrio sp. OttesenSCG-928-G11]|nr:hypothetical protein [Desulfovibrio sp. OttesenSCG-928-G11]